MSERSGIKRLVCVFGLSLALVFGACGKKPENKTPEKSPTEKGNEKTPKKEPTKTVKPGTPPKGQTVIPDAAGFRVPPGGEHNVHKIAGRDSHWYTYKTLARPALVAQVKGLMKSGGWMVASEKTIGSGIIKLEARKGGTLVRMLFGAPKAGGSSLITFVFKGPAPTKNIGSLKTGPAISVPGVLGMRVPGGGTMKPGSSGRIRFVEFTYPVTTTNTQVPIITALKGLLAADGWTVSNVPLKSAIGWRATKGGQTNNIMISKNSQSQLVVSVLLASTPRPSGSAALRIPKTTYHPREPIVVSFTALPYFRSNAWIGIIPSHIPHGSERVNDKYDLSYKYLKGRLTGTLVFKAPRRRGSFDLRMHDTDNNGREVTHVSFTVQ